MADVGTLVAAARRESSRLRRVLMERNAEIDRITRELDAARAALREAERRGSWVVIGPGEKIRGERHDTREDADFMLAMCEAPDAMGLGRGTHRVAQLIEDQWTMTNTKPKRLTDDERREASEEGKRWAAAVRKSTDEAETYCLECVCVECRAAADLQTEQSKEIRRLRSALREAERRWTDEQIADWIIDWTDGDERGIATAMRRGEHRGSATRGAPR